MSQRNGLEVTRFMATAAERQKAQATRLGFLLGHDLEAGFVERFADRIGLVAFTSAGR
jgi:hypothetical protein